MIVTVIDGIGRFPSPEKLVSYVGLGIRHSESAGKVKKGHITKEGDSLFRKVVANVIAKHSMFCGGSDLSKYYRRMKMQFSPLEGHNMLYEKAHLHHMGDAHQERTVQIPS